MGNKYLKIFLAFFSCILFAAKISAVTITSTATGGNWSVAGSWTGGVVPTNANDVVIAATATITVNGNPSCNNITVNGTLNQNASTLSVYGNFTNSGTLTITGGTISFTGTGNQTISGSNCTFNSLTIANTGTSPTNIVTLGTNVTVGYNFTLTSGVFDVSASNYSLEVDNNFTNNASSTAFIGRSGTVTLGNGAGVNGNMILNGSSSTTFYNLIVNVGNTYSVTATAVAETVSNSLSVNAGNTLTANANTISAGTLTNNGTITMSSGTLNITAGALTNNSTGTITFSSGTLLPSSIVNNSGTISFSSSGSMSSSGLVTNNSGAFITFSSGVFIASNGISNSGTISYSSNGSLSVTAGSFTNTGTGTITMGNGTLTTVIALNNAGTITFSTGTFNVNSGVALTNTGTITYTGSGKLNLTGNFTQNGTYNTGTSTTTINGTSGTEAFSSNAVGGFTFYDLVFSNTSATIPGSNTTANFNVTDQITYSSGCFDLKGNTLAITSTAGSVTDKFSAGSIISSSAGAQFNVTDPDTIITMQFKSTSGTRFVMGSSTVGITASVIASDISFEFFTQYGTALFEKTGDQSTSFKGGNGFHGPVTFTAYKATQLWKFATFSTAPTALDADTFYTATINAGANGVGSGNNNFIIGSNNTTTFNGTTTITSTTDGGVYFGRSNGTGNANITFNGPVICNISYTGNMTFCDAAAGLLHTVTFNNTIQLNSTSTSTGYYYFGAPNSYSTITLGTSGQFIGTGSLLGKSNVYLSNVTQNGTTLTQTINTGGSTGFLEIGGKTSSPAYACTFNAPCNFTADTAGYIVSCTFGSSANLTFTVNHVGANGYLLSNTFGGTVTATVGNIRLRSNTFNNTTNLTMTAGWAGDSSTSNGGNTFYAATTITNSGIANLYLGSYAADYFNSDITLNASGTFGCLISVGSNYTSYFAGNITANSSNHGTIYFGCYPGISRTGGISIIGTGTQTFSVGPSNTIPVYIYGLTMNATGSGDNILQFNFSPTLIGALTFATYGSYSSGGYGLININGNTLTMGISSTSSTTLGTISYPSTVVGWAYGGTFNRWISATAFNLPTAASNVSTKGFFPVGSNPTLNYFQPFWFACPGSGVSASGILSLTQPSNASGSTAITSYLDASWGKTVVAVSNAEWLPSEATAITLAGTASLMYGGFGFATFIDADVNASNGLGAQNTYVAPLNLYGALTDVEVQRSGLSMAGINNHGWFIGTSNNSWGASPLPIQLTSFTADCNNYAALLQWTTATETNNDHFTIERTKDGINYETVVVLKGAGNSTSPLTYSVSDESPLNGTSYYRLSQTDFDGKTTNVSTIVYVPCESENSINSYASDNSSVKVEINSTDAGPYVVSLFNSLGQSVFSKSYNVSVGLNSYTLYPHIDNGLYILRITGNTSVYTKKLLLGR